MSAASVHGRDYSARHIAALNGRPASRYLIAYRADAPRWVVIARNQIETPLHACDTWPEAHACLTALRTAEP